MRQDYQQNSPVEDIIDPDLCPYRLPNSFNWIVSRRDSLQKTKELMARAHLRDTYRIDKTLKTLNSDYYTVSEGITVRTLSCHLMMIDICLSLTVETKLSMDSNGSPGRSKWKGEVLI